MGDAGEPGVEVDEELVEVFDDDGISLSGVDSWLVAETRDGLDVGADISASPGAVLALVRAGDAVHALAAAVTATEPREDVARRAPPGSGDVVFCGFVAFRGHELDAIEIVWRY